MFVLGIDPGIANTGWGVVDFLGQKFHPVCYGVVKTETSDSLEKMVKNAAQNARSSVSSVVHTIQTETKERQTKETEKIRSDNVMNHIYLI